jgi:23S rRNA (cytidine2498-2'-O)-methyltransferase
VYQSIDGFADHLEYELNSLGSCGREACWSILGGPLYAANINTSAANGIFWYRNRWLEPFIVEFDSINHAADALRAIQRNWAQTPAACFRRAALIGKKLPPISAKPKAFPWTLPQTPMGAWALLDEHTMIASARCTSPFPSGMPRFAETRHAPSRAYLKLWEALTLCRAWPGPGSVCLDAGASPGGWTWALSQLGAEVTAVDRAELEGEAASAAKRFIKHDAFTLTPGDIGSVDWLFCDAACYPGRLYRWIETWLESGLCKNFICTIKMQGVPGREGSEPDFETPRLFAAVRESRVVHLYHNKHELTWIKLAADSTQS